MSADGTYNGWANRQTWNVCLWIGNDEGLYTLAKDCVSYEAFRLFLREVLGNSPLAFETPDSVSWNDSNINLYEMNEFWKGTFSKLPI